MLATTQDPVVAVTDAPLYSEIRRMQLKGKADNPFSMMFLFWLYEHFMDEMFERLSKENRKRLDSLLMLQTLIYRADHRELTGIDEETLVEVVGEVTRWMKWE